MRKKGFTLVELLASIAIISLLIVVTSAIFSINIKASKNAYENEVNYKETVVAMMYIENVIRGSHKIELIEDTVETNFKAYILDENSNKISSVYFKTSKSSDGNNYLMAVRDNISKTTDDISDSTIKSGTIRIAKCKDLYVKYDLSNDIATIILNKNDRKLRFESKIYLGDRL